MNSWKVILATVVIFGAGVLTGGLLVNHVDREHGPMPASGRGNPRARRGSGRRIREIVPAASPEMWRRDFVGHLDEALKLTPEQHAAISKIIAEGQERNREIWTNVARKCAGNGTGPPAHPGGIDTGTAEEV